MSKDTGGPAMSIKAQRERGFAAIGLDRCKDIANFGGVMRAAGCYDAALIVIGEGRFRRSSVDTQRYEKHCPVIESPSSVLDYMPVGAVPICIEIGDGAVPLHTFVHPESAFYIFGPEDGSVQPEIAARCAHKVMIPTRHCMNLAATVNVVLYDRMAKRSKP